jgi:hypothetical protein
VDGFEEKFPCGRPDLNNNIAFLLEKNIWRKALTFELVDPAS